MKQSLRVRVRRTRGAELIEFALVFPMLMFVIIGIFDFAMLFQRYLVITDAAREGARLATIRLYTDPKTDCETRAKDFAAAAGVPTGSFTATCTFATGVSIGGGPVGDTVTVTVTYPYQWMFMVGIGKLLGADFATVNLKAVTTMRREIVLGS